MKRIGNTLPWESVDLEETGLVHSAIDFVDVAVALCTRAAGMHHAFRDTLVVDEGDFFAEVEVLHQVRTRARP